MKLFRKLKNEKPEHDGQYDEKAELTQVSLEELLLNAGKEIAFLCIGSDRAIADSLGPLVGTMLKENNLPYPVYGTLEAPVHALNLEATLEGIRHGLPDHLLIVLDACIGQEEEVGMVFLQNGPLHPGLAIGNSLPPVGDFHLIAVVNYQDKNVFENYLSDTRLFTIYDMAQKTSELILAAAWSIKEK
ncbi:MAG: spore protease YyaC [Planococcus sp. (in: Bacteria)]|nr:spore protease YyaC [Planococcus sp. (in: firmicutes)]